MLYRNGATCRPANVHLRLLQANPKDTRLAEHVSMYSNFAAQMALDQYNVTAGAAAYPPARRRQILQQLETSISKALYETTDFVPVKKALAAWRKAGSFVKFDLIGKAGCLLAGLAALAAGQPGAAFGFILTGMATIPVTLVALMIQQRFYRDAFVWFEKGLANGLHQISIELA